MTDLPKRTAGELGLAKPDCICDPMDLAALGHMTNCPSYGYKRCPSGRGWCNLAGCQGLAGCMVGMGFLS